MYEAPTQSVDSPVMLQLERVTHGNCSFNKCGLYDGHTSHILIMFLKKSWKNAYLRHSHRKYYLKDEEKLFFRSSA